MHGYNSPLFLKPSVHTCTVAHIYMGLRYILYCINSEIETLDLDGQSLYIHGSQNLQQTGASFMWHEPLCDVPAVSAFSPDGSITPYSSHVLALLALVI